MRRVYYWIGWLLAGVGYLAIMVDLAVMMFIGPEQSTIIAAMTGDRKAQAIIFAWVLVVLAFMYEDE